MIVWKDNQAFADYRNWECYRAGYWSAECLSSDHDQQAVQKSVDLLSSVEGFRTAIGEILESWPISAAVHLSNPSVNEKSFLGQTSCFIVHGANRCCTIAAWWQLDTGTQAIANEVARSEALKWYLENVSCRQQKNQLEFPFMRLQNIA